MKCFYINLNKETNRRSEIEKNFLDNKSHEWSLTRFSAIDTDFVKKNKIQGKLKDSEKACFLSHKFVVKENIKSQSPIFILEDDTIFGKNTCKILDNFFKKSNNFDWDILFTDIIVPQPTQMIELAIMRNELSKKKTIEFINLTKFNFAGTMGYIINSKSIEKFFNLLEINGLLNIPYDLFLRKLIFENKLKGFVTFPFITSMSKEGYLSQIQEKSSADLVWHAFRQMIWLERDIKNVEPILKKIEDEICDENSKQLSTIISACISKNFISK